MSGEIKLPFENFRWGVKSCINNSNIVSLDMVDARLNRNLVAKVTRKRHYPDICMFLGKRRQHRLGIIRGTIVNKQQVNLHAITELIPKIQ